VATWHWTNTTSTVIEVSFYPGSGAFVQPGQKLTFNDGEGGRMALREPGTRVIRTSGRVKDIAQPGD
jgi:hypothetical protein